jgi:hypothetical protein
MTECKPVSVPSAAFVFCRYTLMIMVWGALIFRWKWLAGLVFIILILSASFKIGRAPLIVLYSCTINRLFKSHNEILDENAMRFAHCLGATIILISLLFLYLINERVGWVILFFLAIIKTIGALGYCPASKLYSCITAGGCCRFIRKNSHE